MELSIGYDELQWSRFLCPNSSLHVTLLTKAYLISLGEAHLPLIPRGKPQWWKTLIIVVATLLIIAFTLTTRLLAIFRAIDADLSISTLSTSLQKLSSH
jgi:hypothetical protein